MRTDPLRGPLTHDLLHPQIPLPDAKAAARDPREAEADAFACNLLIPPAEYERFCASGDFSVQAITGLPAE